MLMIVLEVIIDLVACPRTLLLLALLLDWLGQLGSDLPHLHP